MKRISFIGAYDKTDFIIYIGKLLTGIGLKVLVVDATISQKAKYVVPVINPTKSYVTEYEEMDVAVGFEDYNDIKEYLGMPIHAALVYDIILIDVDSPERFKSFEVETNDKHYFITSFDLYSLKRGLEILSGITNIIPITKVLFSKNATKEEDDYLNFLSLGYKIEWAEERVYFPFEVGDQSIIIENQRVSKIRFKKLSNQYKEGLMYIAQQIIEERNWIELRRVFKQLEKGV